MTPWTVFFMITTLLALGAVAYLWFFMVKPYQRLITTYADQLVNHFKQRGQASGKQERIKIALDVIMVAAAIILTVMMILKGNRR